MNLVSFEILRCIGTGESFFHSVPWIDDEYALVIARGSCNFGVRGGSGEPGPLLRGHTSTVYEIALSPNGRWIASSSSDETMTLWDASTGNLVSSLNGHNNGVACVAFSPDGLQLALGGADNRMRLWEAKSCLSSSEVQGWRGGEVKKLAYTLDGQSVLSFSHHALQTWNRMTGERGSLPFEFQDPVSIDTKDFPPDGNQISYGNRHDYVRWHVTSDKHYSKEWVEYLDIVCYSPCCRWVAFSKIKNEVGLWEQYDTLQQPYHVLLEAKEGITPKVLSTGTSLVWTRLMKSCWSNAVRSTTT